MSDILRIAVAGATGALGVHIMTAITAAGHEAVPLSRGAGIDLLGERESPGGERLVDALRGVAAVIDSAGPTAGAPKDPVAFFSTVTRNLLAAEREAGVPHHIAVSIVGAAEVDANYYAGKAAQEALVREQPGGWTILRATQFHEFAAQMVVRGRLGPIQAVPRMRSQPIAASEVAAELVTIAAGDPRGIEPDLAGPREERMAELVRRYLAARGERRPVLEFPYPGRWGRSLRDGSLLPRAGAKLGRQTFDEWLAALPAEDAAS